MQDEQPDFRKILDALTTASVRFVVIGGLAMVAQGSNHITQDIDVGYQREQNNYSALANASANHQPRVRVGGVPEGLPFPFDARTLNNTQ